MFKPSMFNIFVHLRRGNALVYNSLSGSFALWNEAELATYEMLSRGESLDVTNPITGSMLHGGFIVGGFTDELEVLDRHYRTHRFDPRMTLLTIAPTMACNFGCDYCFQGSDKPTDTMSTEVQAAIVQYVSESIQNGDKLHIAWYGGEPLLRKGVLLSLSDQIISLKTKQHFDFDAMIVTNGYLLTRDVAKSLESRYVNVAQVTIDGDARTHDKRRALLSGKPTFHRIVENLTSSVESTRISYLIRINIDRRNADGIFELLDYMSEHGLGGRSNFHVYFAPVEAITTGCHSVADVCMTKSEYGDFEAALNRYAYEKRLSSLPYPQRYRGTCGAVRPKGFVILPSGLVHKCWDTVHKPLRAIGNIFDMSLATKSAEAVRWTDWTPLQHDTCRKCKLLPSCAGACAYKFLYNDDTRGEQANLPCPSWKYNIKERLVLRAEKLGVISAEDYDSASIRTNPHELCGDGVVSRPLHAIDNRVIGQAKRRSLPILHSSIA